MRRELAILADQRDIRQLQQFSRAVGAQVGQFFRVLARHLPTLGVQNDVSNSLRAILDMQ